MISLYESTETSFTSNGIVVLSDAISCFVSEELNGNFECSLEYPLDERGKWQYLIEENILKVGGQLFRIYYKQKTLNGIKVNARHIFYDLLDNLIEDCTLTNIGGAGALSLVLANTQYEHPFTSAGDVAGSETTQFIRRNPVDIIMGDEGILSIWGGELVRNNFLITLSSARGLDRGVLVAYGKNIQGIEETIDKNTLCTRLMPVGKDDFLLPEKYVDSQYISNYPHPKIRVMDFYDCESESDLRTAAQEYMADNQIDIPQFNYKVDFQELGKTEEYKNYAILETVYMGDTVTIRHTKLNINVQAKVIRIKKNELTNRIEEVELGSFRPSYLNGLTNPLNDLKRKQDYNKTAFQQAVEDVTELLTTSLGGYVIKKPGEILIMDTESELTATKVWRWNLNGLGYSGTGIEGPYTLAMTMEGAIVGSFITGLLGQFAEIRADCINVENGKIDTAQIETLTVGTNVAMGTGAVINWNSVTPPTYSQVGAKAAGWTPSISQVTDLAGYLTSITGEGIYTGTLIAQQIYGLLLEAVTIKTGKIVGINDEAFLAMDDYGGGVDTHIDHTEGVPDRKAIRLIPGTAATYSGYLQVLEDGTVFIYDNTGSGNAYASIRLDGYYFGSTKLATGLVAKFG